MEFGILGPLQVTRGGHPVFIPPGKRRTLLVALLVHCNQVVSVARLVDWIWGDEPPEDAASALQSHVSRLRAALGAPPGGEPVIATHGSGYELQAPVEAIDSVRFERQVTAARTFLRGDPGTASATLRQALALWRGRALDGLADQPFAHAESVRLEDARLAAIEDLMESELAQDRHAAVAGELQSLVAENPTRERLTALLMRALYRAGRQAEALSAYGRLRRRLVDELGIEPTQELRHLERAVLRQEVEAPGAVPAPPTGISVPVGLPSTAPHERLLPERTPFVGRQVERDELRRLVDRALGGEGGLVMIGGEPGVGKSRLVHEVAASAPRPVRALIGHCYEAQGDLPFMPWVEFLEQTTREVAPETLRRALGEDAPELARVYPALRRLFPDIPSPLELPPAQQRRYTFSSIRDYLERVSRMRPQLLVLEDLHWADEGTLLFTRFIAENLPTMPCLVVGTYRDPPVDVSPQLADTLDHLVRERRARIITLRRHSEAEVGAMLGALSGQHPPPDVTAAIHAETEGNAFFVEEVFRHLADTGRLLDAGGRFRTDLSIDELDVPENVRLVTGRRLDRLGEATRRLLLVAAISGRRSSFQLLEAVGELNGDALLDALEEAEQARVMFTESSALQTHHWFAHELIRQTLLARLTPPRRKHLHLRVANALERLHAGDLDRQAAHIAHHLVEAGELADGERTARHLTMAADRSLTAAAFEDALNHLANALAVLPAHPTRQRADLLGRIGRAQRSLCRWQDAVATWDEAVAVLEALGEVDAAADLAWEYSQGLGWQYRIGEMLAVTDRALAALGDRGGPRRIRLLAMSGNGLGLAGDYDGARARVEEAGRLADAEADPRLRGEVGLILTIFHDTYMQLNEMERAGERAASDLRETGALWNLAETLCFVDLALVFQGRFAESDEVVAEVGPLADRIGQHAVASVLRRNAFPKLAARSGNLRSLEEMANVQFAVSSEMGNPMWLAYANALQGIVRIWRGEWVAARPYLEQGARLAMPGIWFGPQHGLLVLLLALLGEADEARGVLDSVALPSTGGANLIGAWTLGILAAEAVSLLGDTARARALHPLVLEALATGSVMRQYDGALVERVAGMVAATADLPEEAEEHFETAMRQAEELPHIIERPQVRHWYARFLLARGGTRDVERAHELLDEAIADYRVIGMPRHEEMARLLLGRLV